MTRLEEETQHDLFPRSARSYTKEQQIISTVALLVIGYYVASFFDVWPDTLKRSFYESTIRAVPSPFIYVLQQVMLRLGRISDPEILLRREDFGKFQAKEEALHQLFGCGTLPVVLSRARSLSGYTKLLPTNNETGPPGLGNWDNSCYQNSVLQGFASLPAFCLYVQKSLQLCEDTESPSSTTQALSIFVEQLATSACPKTTLWTPKILKSMDSWQQQDAQEYFSRVLEAIEKESLQYARILNRQSHRGLDDFTKEISVSDRVKHSNDSRVRGILNAIAKSPIDGMLAQALACQTCGFSEGVSLTQFNCLTLNLGLGGNCYLEDLLDEYTEKELIDGVECERCTKEACSDQSPEPSQDDTAPMPEPGSKPKMKPVLRTKAKQILLGRLPKDLVFHINRSIFDESGEQKKNTSLIRFPRRLEVLGRWCVPLDEEPAAIESVYELQCIVTHQGRHDNGHYVAYAKRGKEWYCFNDEIVTKMSEQEVLSRGNVFMLFYEAAEGLPWYSTDAAHASITDAVLTQGTIRRASSSSGSDVFAEALPESIATAAADARMSSSILPEKNQSDGVFSPQVVSAS